MQNMKRLSFLVFFMLFAFKCFAESGVQEKFSNGQKYLLQLPKGYNTTERYPLLIAIHWLHGNASEQINEWKFIANKNGYILVSPEFVDGYQKFAREEDQKLCAVLEDVKRDFSVAESKIFITGFSGGAQFAHRFVFKYPLVCRAACIMAAGDYDAPPNSKEAKAVKYFVGVGTDDKRLAATTAFYKKLKAKGYDVTFKTFPRVGHTLHSSIKQAVSDFLKNVLLSS